MEVGGYPITRELGRGGMGVVYEAFDPAHQRQVALKTVHLDSGRPKASTLERMRREAAALARLEHPGLIPCLDAGETPQGVFLVMELVEGQALGDLLRTQGPLGLARALQIMGDVAEVLAYVHSQGYLHRDLKPDNVMLSSSGRVLLADFGMVKLTDEALDGQAAQSLTRSGALLGTPGFCPPEQALGRGVIGPAADVYGWAATLYALLVGRPPRSIESLHAFFASLRASAPSLRHARPEVPEWLDELLQTCLAFEPAERPSLAALRAALQAPRTARGAGRGLKILAGALALAATASTLAVATLVFRDAPAASATDDVRPYRWALLGERLAEGPEAAQAWSEAWLAAEPTSGDAHAARARVALARRNVPLAREHALAALEAGDLSPAGLAVCGRAQLHAERVDLAREYLSRARAADPDAVEVVHLDAQLKLLSKDFAGAVEGYARVIEAQPWNAGARASRGWALDQLDRFDDALAAAREALELAPDFLYAQRLVVHVHARHLDEPAAGIARLREFIAEHPDQSSAIKDLAVLLEEQGQGDEAIAVLERATAGNDPSGDLLYLLGTTRYQRKEVDEALVAFARLIDVGGEHTHRAHLMRGQILAQRKEWTQGLAEFERALETELPDLRALVYTMRSKVYTARRDLPAAAADLREVIALEPSRRSAYEDLMRLLVLDKKTPEAGKVAATYLETLSGDPELDVSFAEIVLATAASSRDDQLAAVKHYTNALAINDKPAIRAARASSYVKLSRFQEAAVDYGRATELDPTSENAWIGLMDALNTLERVAEAKVAAQRYLDLGATRHAEQARAVLAQ